MTTYQIVEANPAPHPNLLVVQRDQEAEAIAGIAGLVDWFDPAAQYVSGETAGDFRLLGKRNGGVMVAPFNNRPVSSLIGMRPSLSVGGDGLGTTALVNGAFELATADAMAAPEAYTVMFVMALGADSVGSPFAMVATGAAAKLELTSGGRLRGSASRDVNSPEGMATMMTLGGTGKGNHLGRTSVVTVAYGGGVFSFRSSIFPTPASQSYPLVPSLLKPRLGGGSEAASATPGVTNARFGDMLVFNQDMTVASRAADYALALNYLRTKYEIAV